MGFLDRILGLFYKRENAKNNNPSDESQQPQNENAAKLLECGGFFASLLDQDKYIAKSEYKDKRDKYAPVIDFFTVLRSSDMLEEKIQQVAAIMETVKGQEFSGVLDLSSYDSNTSSFSFQGDEE